MNSVRTRILVFVTAFAVVSSVALYMTGQSTRAIGDVANLVVNKHLPMVHALAELEISLRRQDNAVYRYLISNDKSWLDDWEKERVNYNRAFISAKKWASDDVEQDKLNEVDELYVQYDNETRQILLTRGRDAGKAMQMVKFGDQYLVKIGALIDQLKGFRQGMTKARQEQINEILGRYGRVAYLFLITIVVFIGALWAYLWKYVVQPLSLLLEGIRNFTRGKTDVQVPAIGKDELGELQEAFNEMSREIDSERKRLRTESQSDSLTGLFNMRYFRLQLAEEFSRSQRYGRPLTLLMIDVDHFKAYNDRNGHPAGDIVLKEVSRILIRNVRGTDIVARYGGEEFVVLLPETPVESGLNVAEKIRRAAEEHYFPFAGRSTAQKLTVSIGVASYPDANVTSDQDLVECSDKALYAAKRDGRNKVFLMARGETVSAAIQLGLPKKSEAAASA